MQHAFLCICIYRTAIEISIPPPIVNSEEIHEVNKTPFLKIALGVVLPVLLVVVVLIGIGLSVKPVRSVIKKWKESETNAWSSCSASLSIHNLWGPTSMITIIIIVCLHLHNPVDFGSIMHLACCIVNYSLRSLTLCMHGAFEGKEEQIMQLMHVGIHYTYLCDMTVCTYTAQMLPLVTWQHQKDML